MNCPSPNDGAVPAAHVREAFGPRVYAPTGGFAALVCGVDHARDRDDTVVQCRCGVVLYDPKPGVPCRCGELP